MCQCWHPWKPHKSQTAGAELPQIPDLQCFHILHPQFSLTRSPPPWRSGKHFAVWQAPNFANNSRMAERSSRNGGGRGTVAGRIAPETEVLTSAGCPHEIDKWAAANFHAPRHSGDRGPIAKVCGREAERIRVSSCCSCVAWHDRKKAASQRVKGVMVWMWTLTIDTLSTRGSIYFSKNNSILKTIFVIYNKQELNRKFLLIGWRVYEYMSKIVHSKIRKIVFQFLLI